MVLFFSSSPLQRNPARYATKAASASESDVSDAKAYDYVIVGGGTAGCVLASRLSEDPSVSVLVIEAGKEGGGLNGRIPLTFTKMFRTDVDWDYTTTPQNEKLFGKEMQWPRGKMLGGCSSINAMMYQQANFSDYDEWEAAGCKGYGHDDMQPYVRRVENFTLNPKRHDIVPEHRGVGGLLQTGHSHIAEVSEKAFLPACAENGIPEVADINTPKGCLGAVRFMTMIDSKGQRSSAYTAYLDDSVKARKNLTIAIETYVTRVLFDKSGSKPRAVGVELQQKPGAPLYRVKAKSEVLICGGALNTPQTLMLSGIGPADELKKHNIAPLVTNEHVGRHLKDHLVCSPCRIRAKPQFTYDDLASDIAAIPALVQWLATGTGRLTSNVGEVACFFNAAKINEKEKLVKAEYAPENNGSHEGKGPDIEVIATPICYLDHGATTAPPGHGVISMTPIGLRPRSEGSVTLKSNSVFDKAIVDANYWSDPSDNDRKTLLAGMRICMKLMRSKAYEPYILPVEEDNDPNNFYWPYCADHSKVTDEQLLEWMGREAFTLYHPVSTCKLGTSPKDSVVDVEMKVHGTEGLRVVDASIFPEQISGHPCAVVYALAEKASDLIMGRHAKSNGAIAK